MKKAFQKRINSIKKKVSKIPSGPYCYTIDNNGTFKICPFWKKDKKGAQCKFLKLKSKKYNPFNLIWDQCKECNINF